MEKLQRISPDRKSPKRRQVITKQAKITADKFLAASIGDVEWLDQSLKDGQDPCSFDKNGLTPLHLAALHGRMNCMKLLIDKYDVDVDVTSATGWHPIHLSINKESGTNAIKCMKYLLEQGADVNCVNDDNVTVVHQAATEGLFDCLQVLLQNDAPIDTPDVRGHTPYDLAKLWSHKKCARVIQDEVWKRNKVKEVVEKKKLNKLKQVYGDLQKEALQQILNEQEFYGSVTYSNWLEEKGLPENLKDTKSYARERYPDSAIDGLAKRLMVSGKVQDCASRMDKLSSKAKPVQTRKKTISKQAYPNSTAKAKPKIIETSDMQLVKSQGEIDNKLSTWNKTPKPYAPRGPFWNPSTNVNSPPVTNIKRADDETIHDLSRDEFQILPPEANLSVKLTGNRSYGTSIRVTLPGGREQSASIQVPSLPSEVIHKALHGSSERVKLPQDFTPVHIFDVKHKRIPPYQPPVDDIGMHLSIHGNHNIASAVGKSPSEESIRERMISTLKRGEPMQPFLV
nr:ankyrin repeat domain-containing protein 53 [Ciona intestinalis]|eukprot:XP_002129924.1 ankyrin repeat domain-containing protein 53 [Ciona intestinalis]